MKGRHEMVITENLKRRFVKDTALPIKIFDDTVFFDRLRLFEPVLDSAAKWKQFVEYLRQFKDEHEFFDEQDRIKQAAIDYITNTEAFQAFNCDDMNKYQCNNTGYPGNGVFKDCHVGKYLLSIDMVKANFTSLRHYNPDIFGGAEIYEDFIGKFTDSEYVKSSKYIRQVIFGNINPKRTQTYERYLMDKILTALFSHLKVERKKVLYFGSDEIVIDISEFVHDEEIDEKVKLMVEKIVEQAKADGINVRHEYYEMMKIVGTAGFVKNYFSDTCTKDNDFKCLDPIEYPFVVRNYLSEEPQPCDFIFMHESRKAQLLEPIEVKFTCHIEGGDV